MRRFLPLLVLSTFIVVFLFVSMIYLSGSADTKNSEPLHSITIYVTVPIDSISPLTDKYETVNKVKIKLHPISPEAIINYLNSENNDYQADIVIADKTTIEKLSALSLLIPHITSNVDMVSQRFKHSEGFWTGIWYDPIVFAFNRDHATKKTFSITSWQDLNTSSISRVALPDFAASESAGNILFALASSQSEKITLKGLSQLHAHTVQYAKYIFTPARLAVMGECDIAVTLRSEAIRYIEDGFPVKFIYPKEGSPYILTAVGKLQKQENNPAILPFIDWLLSSEIQSLLHNNRFHYISTNPDGNSKLLKENVILLDNTKYKTPALKKKLMDDWLMQVRLAK